MNKMNSFKIVIAAIFIGFYQFAFGWGVDKVISPFGPSAQHSMAAKQNGVLYAALPGVGIVGPNIVTVYVSFDNGDTWNIAPVGGLPVLSPVLKTKMLTTALDSVYCLFLQDNSVYFLNVESGTLGQFNQTGADDFDAVASESGNWIYIYIDEPANNNIRRYGTETGGLTWTGNSALVTGNGANPKICLSGTSLILNYYGPVMPDVPSSIIRAAIYNESSPGTLAASTFQDIVTNTSVKKKQFQTVINNGVAWFLFTEGDNQQELKCRNSIDGGTTYQTEFIVAGNANINAFWFGTAAFFSTASNGVTITYLADSIAPSGSSFNTMQFLSSSTLTPSVFTLYPPPFDTYNDTSVFSASVNVLPVLVNYNTPSMPETGISWVGDSPQGPWLYFDKISATVGLSAQGESTEVISIYPSPAHDVISINFSFKSEILPSITIFNTAGQLMEIPRASFTLSGINSSIKLNIASLPSGSYFIRVTDNEINYSKIFVVSK